MHGSRLQGLSAIGLGLALAALSALTGCRPELAARGPGRADAGADADADPGASGTLTAVVNRQYLPLVNQLLDGATRSISLVHLMLNDDSAGDALVERLKAAAGRGVAVSVLLEDSVESNPSRVASLVAAGVKARLDSPARYTHAKLVVVDGEQALLGSTNGSWSSLQRNNEANVLAADPRLGGWFERYAQAVFAAPEQAPGLVPIATPLGRTLHDGDYLGRAQPLIDGAQRRIDVVTYAMNADPRYPDSDVNQLIRRLGAARRRGVKVQVLLEQSAPDLGVNAVNQEAAAALRGEGIDVRYDPLDTITHAKVLRADDEVIVGSNNWGYGGFRSYHEVGVQTRAPEVVAALGRYLDELWATGTPAP